MKAVNPEARLDTLPGSSHAPLLKIDSVSVQVESLVKAYGEVQAVRGVDFTVEPGTTVTLLGPSGCGKTTTLRCIAGLEVPTAGRIKLGERIVYDSKSGTFVEPERRNIGMVFQSYAIWPHMTVGGNVGFPLKIARAPRAEIDEKVSTILDLVGLGELRQRSAAALSGGQQQRVALARALVHQPSIVLFDEPLSNLDANLRTRMRTELQLLQSRLGFTAIYVTHDQEEAMALSDQVIIINKGVIEQQGTPQEVFNRPATAFTAAFLGYSNSLRGRVVELREGGIVRVKGEDGISVLARWDRKEAARAGQEVQVAFRADKVEVGETGPDATDNAFRGTVAGASFLGTYVDYTIEVGATQIKAESSVGTMPERGATIDVHVAPEHCHAFPTSGDSADLPTDAVG